jgi:hypothetical protein
VAEMYTGHKTPLEFKSLLYQIIITGFTVFNNALLILKMFNNLSVQVFVSNSTFMLQHFLIITF